MTKARLIVGITGASGATYGVRTLHILRRRNDIETVLVVTNAGLLTVRYEMGLGADDLRALADEVYDIGDLAAPIASGSHRVEGMIVAPCSMKTLSAVANAYGDNLLTRAADVCLKERRRLVLLVRETPLHAGHIRLMQLATKSGAIVFPPVPAFYTRPETIEDLVDQTVLRALSLLGIENEQLLRWDGATAV
jgi:polyprenyl P-hydroxybenzoate/phenylacrylic acid decarboxylase-like protein